MATASATPAGETPFALAATSSVGQTATTALNALRCSTSSTCTKQVTRTAAQAGLALLWTVTFLG
jgi:hypothetical protein